MDNQKQIVERLKQANNVLVTVSNNPSVDQLAACIGLSLALNKLDKHAAAVYSGRTPSIIEFLEPDSTFEKTTDSLRDFIISLDKSKADKLRYKVEDEVVRIFITPYRTSINQDDLEFSQGDFNVDVVAGLGVHEQKDLDQAITSHGRILHGADVVTVNTATAAELGVINWLDEGASSLSEMTTALVNGLGKDVLDEQIATALLTGIVAETDRFSNEKTSANTMKLSAILMAAGANQQLVAAKLEEPVEVPEVRDADDGNADSEGKEELPQAAVSDDGTLRISHTEEEKRPKKEAKKPEKPGESKEPEESEPPKDIPEKKVMERRDDREELPEQPRRSQHEDEAHYSGTGSITGGPDLQLPAVQPESFAAPMPGAQALDDLAQTPLPPLPPLPAHQPPPEIRKEKREMLPAQEVSPDIMTGVPAHEEDDIPAMGQPHFAAQDKILHHDVPGSRSAAGDARHEPPMPQRPKEPPKMPPSEPEPPGNDEPLPPPPPPPPRPHDDGTLGALKVDQAPAKAAHKIDTDGQTLADLESKLGVTHAPPRREPVHEHEELDITQLQQPDGSSGPAAQYIVDEEAVGAARNAVAEAVNEGGATGLPQPTYALNAQPLGGPLHSAEAAAPVAPPQPAPAPQAPGPVQPPQPAVMAVPPVSPPPVPTIPPPTAQPLTMPMPSGVPPAPLMGQAPVAGAAPSVPPPVMPFGQ